MFTYFFSSLKLESVTMFDQTWENAWMRGWDPRQILKELRQFVKFGNKILLISVNFRFFLRKSPTFGNFCHILVFLEYFWYKFANLKITLSCTFCGNLWISEIYPRVIYTLSHVCVWPQSVLIFSFLHLTLFYTGYFWQ